MNRIAYAACVLTIAVTISPAHADFALTSVTSSFVRGGVAESEPKLWLYYANPGEIGFDLRADLIDVEQFEIFHSLDFGDEYIRQIFEEALENISVAVPNLSGFDGGYGSRNLIPVSELWTDGAKHYFAVPTDYTVDSHVSIPGPGLVGTPYRLSAISFTLNSLTSYTVLDGNLSATAYDGTYTLRFWSSVAPEPSTLTLFALSCAAIGYRRRTTPCHD